MYPLSSNLTNLVEITELNLSKERNSDPMDCESTSSTWAEAKGKAEIEAYEPMSLVCTQILNKKRSRDDTSDESEECNASKFKLNKRSSLPNDQKLEQKLLLPELWRKIFEPLVLNKSEIVNLMRVCRLFRNIIQRHPIVGLAHMLAHPSLNIQIEPSDYPSENLSNNLKAQQFIRKIDPMGSKFLTLVAGRSFDNNPRMRSFLATMLRTHHFDIKKFATIDTELRLLFQKKQSEIRKLKKLLNLSASEWTAEKTSAIDWEEIFNTNPDSWKKELNLSKLRKLCLLPLCLEPDHPQRDLIYLVLIKFAFKERQVNVSFFETLFRGPLAEKVNDREFALKVVKIRGKFLSYFKHFRDDREFILTAIQQDPRMVEDDVLAENDWESIWVALDQDPNSFKYLPMWAKRNQKFILAFLECYPNFFHLVPEIWENDRFIIEEFRKQSARQHVVTSIQNIEDKNRVLERLGKEPAIFSALPKELREDWDFIILALEKNENIFDLINKEIINDRKFQLKVMTSFTVKYDDVGREAKPIKFILNMRRNDGEFLLQAAKVNKEKKDRLSAYQILKQASLKLLDSKDFILKAIEVDSDIIRSTRPETGLKNDKEILLALRRAQSREIRVFCGRILNKEQAIGMITGPTYYLRHVGGFNKDPDVCLLALKKNGIGEFQYVASELQHNPQFLLRVIKNMDVFNSELIPLLPPELQQNEYFIQEAIAFHADAIKIASPKLLHNADFLLDAIATNPKVVTFLIHLDTCVAEYPKVIFAALRYDGEILSRISRRWLIDELFMLEAIRINPIAIKYTPLLDDASFLARAIAVNRAILEHIPADKSSLFTT